MSSKLIRNEEHSVRFRTHLQNVDVGNAVGAVTAAIHLDVFEPLDVRLGVAVNLAMKLHVAAHNHGLIGWQACLEDGPVG